MAPAAQRPLTDPLGQQMRFIRRKNFHKGAQMISMLRVAVLAAALAIAGIFPQPARAQIPAELKNPKIAFLYLPPANAKYEPIMQRLKDRQLLEKLAAFLSPLQLPHPFFLITRECKEPNA